MATISISFGGLVPSTLTTTPAYPLWYVICASKNWFIPLGSYCRVAWKYFAITFSDDLIDLCLKICIKQYYVWLPEVEIVEMVSIKVTGGWMGAFHPQSWLRQFLAWAIASPEYNWFYYNIFCQGIDDLNMDLEAKLICLFVSLTNLAIPFQSQNLGLV